MSTINNNAGLVKQKHSFTLFPLSRSNEYLQDVIDSVKGKKVEPFKKFNIGKLFQAEEIQRQKDSTINFLENTIKSLK